MARALASRSRRLREQSLWVPWFVWRHRENRGVRSEMNVALAPEPYLSACLETIYFATTQARHIGTTGRRSGITVGDAARLDDLMDAIHNLPRLVRKWETVDEERIRAMLADFDARWAEVTSFELLPIYQRAVLGVEDWRR